MGSLISKFKSKVDTKVILEELQNEIESIEDLRDTASRRQNGCNCWCFTVLLLIYLLFAILLFVLVPIENISIQIISYILSFILVLVLFYLFKNFIINRYYRWKREDNEQRLKELKRKKKRILDKVKETENFKDAKEILEKYDPKALFENVSLGALNAFSTPLLNTGSQPFSQTSISQIRYRGNSTPVRQMPAIMSSPFRPQPTPGFQRNIGGSVPFRGPVMTPQRLPVMRPMPQPVTTIKPILSQSRTVMEKLVDYVVGDGPNNRYALICIHCYSHNGMALKEEFEFIAFICCYCKRFNPSRKMKPTAPRLQPLEQNKRSSLTPLVDEPESDTDSEIGRIGLEQTTRIQEITCTTDSDNQNEDNKVEPIHEEQANNEEKHEEVEITPEIDTNISDNKVDVEDKDNTNIETEEDKEMPFIDESDL